MLGCQRHATRHIFQSQLRENCCFAQFLSRKENTCTCSMHSGDLSSLDPQYWFNFEHLAESYHLSLHFTECKCFLFCCMHFTCMKSPQDIFIRRVLEFSEYSHTCTIPTEKKTQIYENSHTKVGKYNIILCKRKLGHARHVCKVFKKPGLAPPWQHVMQTQFSGYFSKST